MKRTPDRITELRKTKADAKATADRIKALEAENGTLREALDDLVAWTGTAKDADDWLAKMEYARTASREIL